jgi:hypothetical protein
MLKAEARLSDERELIASVNTIKVRLTKPTQIWP